jgi:hypothetical protein
VHAGTYPEVIKEILKKEVSMVRLIIPALAATLTLQACNGHKATSVVEKLAKQPQTHIHINKEYDKSGNLVRYDSVYSSYFPNHEGDSTMQDSLFGRFKDHFNENFFFSNHPYFSNFFFEDSLLKYDFYKKDFFYNR